MHGRVVVGAYEAPIEGRSKGSVRWRDAARNFGIKVEEWAVDNYAQVLSKRAPR